MRTATIDREKLLPDLQRMIKALKADLLDRLGQSPDLDDRLRLDAFAPVERAGRTAQAYEVWRLDYLEQVAVAWVLACVFVRYMEDNGLIAETYLAGITPDRRRQAEDAQQAYLNSRHEDDTDRGYLLDVFRRVGSIPAARDLFAEGKTPLWALGPTADGARALLDAWRKIDPETGALLRSFRVEGGDTRFLGDLYQDLSEEVRKKYALLQTPDFVERFLLDHTLTPALDEFGLEAVRTIDPTCGSGHLVLGSFWRLFHKWNEREPGTDPTELARRALKASCGVDINPYAVAITRFRLIVAAMRACGIEDLRKAPGWTVRIATGDSLVLGAKFDAAGRKVASIVGMPLIESASTIYAIEEPELASEILGSQYHVVVGNPPYIQVKDTKQNEIYRSLWKTCHRQYSLGVTFTERFFNLAMVAIGGHSAGYIGMITSNSFMKREFGTKLIEEFFPTVDLTHVIDSSGAYIPGHGTPTVVLFGRNRRPIGETIRALLGIRGEPGTPVDPAQGLVWRAIVDHLNNSDTKNEFLSAANVPCTNFYKHPWSMGGGGAVELKDQVSNSASRKLVDSASSIGFYQDTHADEIFVQSTNFVHRHGLEEGFRDQIRGDDIRDWGAWGDESIVFPYDNEIEQWTDFPRSSKWSWFYNFKTLLWDRSTFGGGTYRTTGRPWFDYHQFPKSRARTPLSIGYAFISTHNHFVLERGERVYNRSAPVIRLPIGAAFDDYLSILAILNCSTACFWMKQVCHNNGNGGIGGGIGDEGWERRFQYDGTKLLEFPVVETDSNSLILARELDTLAQESNKLIPAECIRHTIPIAEDLASNLVEIENHETRMVALQEELDWLCYRRYGLMAPFEWPDGGGDEPYSDPPGLKLGERPFEIAMARKMAAGELQTSWFERHGSTPITEIPGHWPESYRALVQWRLDAIRDDPNIALIERPEYKRRWLREPWDDQVHRALRSWLLDRLETGRYWPDPAHEPPELASCAALAERAARDADFLQVAALYAGRPDFPLARLVEELVTAESVPLLPVLRYRPSGLVKRMVWERTWDLQRREDDKEDVGPIPVPPKYASADFLNSDLWRLRGKLDVPRERFVSYPHASRDGDPSLVVGWAGWDHLRQAQALTAYYERMKSREGWTPDRLAPLLAGLDQLVPWLIQWHNELDPEYDLRMGDYYRDFVADEVQALGFTLEQVRAWTPPAKAKRAGGRKKA
jgi:hypothetical protein